MYSIQVVLPIDFDDVVIKDAIGSLINIPSRFICDVQIAKLSLDGRKKLIHYLATVNFSVKNSASNTSSAIDSINLCEKNQQANNLDSSIKNLDNLGSVCCKSADNNKTFVKKCDNVDNTNYTAVENLDDKELNCNAKLKNNKNNLNIDKTIAKLLKKKVITKCDKPYNYCYKQANIKPLNPPVIVGSGPSGLFAGLILASAGLNPIIIEQGGTVEDRAKAIDNFNKTGNLDVFSNIQFGEGGAGTFSDGKLNTLTKDHRNIFVKQIFAKFGADKNILYLNKPHIGTDKLLEVIPNLRNYIISLGGKFLFNHKVVDFVLDDVTPTVENGYTYSENSATDSKYTSTDSIKNTHLAKNDKILVKDCKNIKNTENNDNLSINRTNISENLCIDNIKTSNNITTNSKKIVGVVVENNGKQFNILTNDVILATGHSSRDIFAKMQQIGANLAKKPFSIGVRIEHPREYINACRYGDANILTKNGIVKTENYTTLYKKLVDYKNSCNSSVNLDINNSKLSENQLKNNSADNIDNSIATLAKLPTADYKLSCHLDNGRSVYTFCMCPGGEVVNASSEKGRLCTNGMSNFARMDRNSNSAVLVNVVPEDFDGDNLSGVEFQRKYEALAYDLTGDYSVPCETVEDFLEDNKPIKLGDVLPSPRYKLAELKKCMPKFVYESLKQGIVELDKKLPGFNKPDAVLLALETRTSSPVRILRNELFESNILGLYPTGEGAGYAGGIMSSAVDGIKVAEKLVEKYQI